MYAALQFLQLTLSFVMIIGRKFEKYGFLMFIFLLFYEQP